MNNASGVGASLAGVVCIIASGAMLYDFEWNHSGWFQSVSEAIVGEPSSETLARSRESLLGAITGFGGAYLFARGKLL